jgi:hypothetical protein
MVFALLATTSLACGSSSQPTEYEGPRFTSAEDHFSVRELPDWKSRRELGSVVFQATRPGLERTTIAVRAVKLDETKLGDVLPATEKALRGLPHASVSGLERIDRYDFQAAAFDVKYEPSSGKGSQYERRHIVLIGKGGWVYHVIHTAPAGELGATADIFQSVLDSFREET